MLRYIKNYIKKKTVGRKKYQRLFNYLLGLSLFGLNMIGGGRNPRETGEAWAIGYVAKKLKDKNNTVVFDAGAQGGDYSKVILEVIGANITLHLFEPVHEECIELQKEFSQCKNVFVHEIALGDKNSKVPFFSAKGIRGLDSFYQRKDSRNEFQLSGEVQSQTVDNFCQTHNINRIDFLKMDVEGAELLCLQGAKHMIDLKKISFIQFEFTSAAMEAGVYFKDIFELLHNNYHIYRILLDGLEEIKAPGSIQEILFTTNYLAELK